MTCPPRLSGGEPKFFRKDGVSTVRNLQDASRSTEDRKKSQDLVRAGLVTVGACLDATLKEVLRSALVSLRHVFLRPTTY